MQGIQGALIVASCFQMVMGFLGFWRNTVRWVSRNFLVCMFLNHVELGHLAEYIIFCNDFWIRFLSPLSVVPCVTFTGLGLYHLGFPMVMQ